MSVLIFTFYMYCIHPPLCLNQNLCTKTPNAYFAVEEQMCFVASFPGLPCFLFFDMCLAHTEKRQQGRPGYEATLLVSILQGHIAITDKMLGPNGVRYRGVPLYMHKSYGTGFMYHVTCYSFCTHLLKFRWPTACSHSLTLVSSLHPSFSSLVLCQECMIMSFFKNDVIHASSLKLSWGCRKTRPKDKKCIIIMSCEHLFSLDMQMS